LPRPDSQQAARDFEKVTDPLAAIKQADISEIRDLQYEEEPVYPEEYQPSEKNLLGDVELADIQNLNLDIVWTYPPAFQESAPIVRTGAVGRIDDDRMPDVVFGTGENQLVVLGGGEGAEVFVQDMGGPFLEPSVVNLDEDGSGEIALLFEDGSLSVLDQDMTPVWTRTGEAFSAAPLFVDVNGDDVRDLIVPTYTMELVALDGSTGFELWRFYDAASEILYPPSALDINADGVQDVLFVTRGGSLHALDGKTGWGL
jgi:outer membrane protein assembly factor BamB